VRKPLNRVPSKSKAAATAPSATKNGKPAKAPTKWTDDEVDASSLDFSKRPSSAATPTSAAPAPDSKFDPRSISFKDEEEEDDDDDDDDEEE